MKLNKKKQSLSTREFFLILVVLVGVIGYFGTDYLVVPKYKEIQSSKEQLALEEERLGKLKLEFEHIETLKEKSEQLKYQLKRMKKELPPYISEESIILSMDDYAKKSKVNLGAIGFQQINELNVESFVTGEVVQPEATEEATEEASKEASAEGETPEQGEAVPADASQTKNGTEAVLQKRIDISINGDMACIYNFLRAIEKNPNRIFVRQLSLSKGEEGKGLSGNMNLEYIAYRDPENKEKFEMEVPLDAKIGNPFTPYEGYKISEDLPGKELNSQFQIVIQRDKEKKPRFIMGEYKKAETEIYYSGSDKVQAKLEIHKQGKEYAYTYCLGKNEKIAQKSLKVENGVIKLEVFSEAARSGGDLTKFVLDIENNTADLLEVVVHNDDVKEPAFSIGKKKGKVHIKELSR